MSDHKEEIIEYEFVIGESLAEKVESINSED